MRGLIAASVCLLAVLGVASSVAYFLKDPYNPGFLEYPITMAVHVILGGVYLALAPLQFVQRIRSRWIDYHRWAGRLLVAIGLVTGATAFLIALLIPFSGWAERLIVGGFAVLFLLGLVKSIVHIRQGRVELHREWMIRAFAIGLAIVTMRLIFIPALTLADDPGLEQVKLLSIISFTVAFVAHLAVAEIWIRKTRSNGHQTVNVGDKAGHETAGEVPVSVGN